MAPSFIQYHHLGALAGPEFLKDFVQLPGSSTAGSSRLAVADNGDAVWARSLPSGSDSIFYIRRRVSGVWLPDETFTIWQAGLAELALGPDGTPYIVTNYGYTTPGGNTRQGLRVMARTQAGWEPVFSTQSAIANATRGRTQLLFSSSGDGLLFLSTGSNRSLRLLRINGSSVTATPIAIDSYAWDFIPVYMGGNEIWVFYLDGSYDSRYVAVRKSNDLGLTWSAAETLSPVYASSFGVCREGDGSLTLAWSANTYQDRSVFHNRYIDGEWQFGTQPNPLFLAGAPDNGIISEPLKRLPNGSFSQAFSVRVIPGMTAWIQGSYTSSGSQTSVSTRGRIFKDAQWLPERTFSAQNGYVGPVGDRSESITFVTGGGRAIHRWNGSGWADSQLPDTPIGMSGGTSPAYITDIVRSNNGHHVIAVAAMQSGSTGVTGFTSWSFD